MTRLQGSKAWVAGLAFAALAAGTAGQVWAESGWGHYGGDAGGQRYVAAEEITPANVSALEEAWRYSTGDMGRPKAALERYALEVTPVLFEGRLTFCTPYNEIVALDPGTGKELWRYDPKVATDLRPANQYVCRGVTPWRDAAAEEGALCASRIFMGTNDARLIAVDAPTGQPCLGFAREGQAQVNPGKDLVWPGEFHITSPPAVVNGKVIIGSAISDNVRVDAPAGVVRAYDARSGELAWTFDPIPRGEEATALGWEAEATKATGHANAWAPISADLDRGLVFVPTSSPSPDFYGGLRKGDNRYANSVVALDAETGEVVWHFQTVHHDVWDYDVPAQPSLVMVMREDGPRDAVAQVTKTGFLFLFDRETGEPLFEIEERPVPQGGAVGEALSPTQPFPVKPPPLVPQHLTEDDAFGIALFDEWACADRINALRSEGLFTPPSEQGTILYPFTGGGANWGGMAFDPERQLAIVNTNRLAHVITLFPAEEYEGERETHHGKEVSPQLGAPYGMRRELLMSPLGIPCNEPPWGTIAAVDLVSGEIAWERPLGAMDVIGSMDFGWGSPNIGGPLATKTGLIFIGASMDNALHAYATETGEELWTGSLPAGGQATPMSYEWQGRQYVVIAAGGNARAGTTLGDTIMAFALPAKAAD